MREQPFSPKAGHFIKLNMANCSISRRLCHADRHARAFSAGALHLLLIFAYYYGKRRLPLLRQKIANRLQIGKDVAFQSLFSVIYGMLTPLAAAHIRTARAPINRHEQPPTSP